MYLVTFYGHNITPDSNGNNTKSELDSAVSASNATALSVNVLEINRGSETQEEDANVSGLINNSNVFRKVFNLVSYAIPNSEWDSFMDTYETIKTGYNYVSVYADSVPYTSFLSVPTECSLGQMASSNIGDYKTFNLPCKFAVS